MLTLNNYISDIYYIYHSYEIALILWKALYRLVTVTPEFIIMQYIHKKLEGTSLFFLITNRNHK